MGWCVLEIEGSLANVCLLARESVFRGRHVANAADSFTVAFEMAPPGSTTLNSYVSGVVRRAGTP